MATCYPKETADFPSQISSLLMESYGILSPDTRKSLVQNLVMLRNKEVITSIEYLPPFYCKSPSDFFLVCFLSFLSPLLVFLLISRRWCKPLTSTVWKRQLQLLKIVVKQIRTSSSSSDSSISSLPRKKWSEALWTFVRGWKHPCAMIETDLASLLEEVVSERFWKRIDITYHTLFFHSSLVRITAHIASSALCASGCLVDTGAALSLPLSPVTSPDMPRSTMLNSIACTARFNLWFWDLVFATFMSDRIVLRM